jgi:hypothetical protein
MAVDYNILRPDGPTNLYAGFAIGQQAAAQNALAQQKLAQERDLMSMRRQEFQANLEASQAERRRKAQVEKTAMFRERVLRAPTPQAARELVRLQHSDPDLGPVMQQFGSLDQDLADIPDDPTGFENWRQREAMGAAEFIKKNAARQRRQDILSQLGEGQPPVEPAAAPAAAAPAAAVAPAAAAVAPAAVPDTTPKFTAPIKNQRSGVGINTQQDIASRQDVYLSQMEMAKQARAEGRPRQAQHLEEMAGYTLAALTKDYGIELEPVAAPVNTLAPTPAPTTNAMLAPAAAAPAAAAPPAALAAAQRPATGRTPERIAREIDLLSQEDDPALKGRIARLMKEYEAALKPDPSELRTMQQLGYPLTQEGYSSFRAAQMREQAPPALVPILQNGKPVLVPREQAVGQTPFSPAAVQVLGMGQGREAPAPTITQIQDPTNPAQMITIDARRYQGGGVGSPGVIGTSGKPAPVAAAAVKQEQGLSKADDILSTLQSAYAQLKERRAIPSEQNNVISNIWASIAASGPGQVAGRTVGTAAQTQRDIIQSSRNQLLLAIKDATGLSAQQLNSNMELQTWLNSLTDPTRSIEANEAILQNVRRFIDSAGRYTAKQGAAPAAPAAQPPASGALTPAEQAELDQLRSRFGGGR